MLRYGKKIQDFYVRMLRMMRNVEKNGLRNSTLSLSLSLRVCACVCVKSGKKNHALIIRERITTVISCYYRFIVINLIGSVVNILLGFFFQKCELT